MSRPRRLATKQARSAASRTDRRVAPSIRERRDPDRGADAVTPASRTDRLTARSDALGDGAPGRVRARQEHRELVAAVAEHVVASRGRAATIARGDLAQQPVAGLVAQRVVDALELVEVQHDEAERLAAGDAALEPVLERAVVEQAGQVVGLGADLDRPVDLGVLEGDRDLRREQLDELELVAR